MIVSGYSLSPFYCCHEIARINVSFDTLNNPHLHLGCSGKLKASEER